MADYWGDVDSSLDQIIALASSLKGHVGGVKGRFTDLLVEREGRIKKVHEDLEGLQKQLDHTSSSHKEERERLERLIHEKEEEQKKKLAEYDANIRSALDEKERIERERESARGDAESEKKRLSTLLRDLEDDALSYSRLRPSKPMLDEDDIKIIRQMFLSSAVKETGKISFSELKQILHKYNASEPEGALKKLLVLVENDTKQRMSYITLVAVSNDLAALVGDFRKIDINKNNTLSRKEFREHYHKLGFEHKNVIDAIFRFADEDESDEVTFSEYVHLSLVLLVLRILYTFADFDKSGSLSKEELKSVLEDAHIPADNLKKFDSFFAVADRDNSKSLGYAEFVQLVMLMFCDD
jgi:Ca2+-binding EF-hand superfamily protein